MMYKILALEKKKLIENNKKISTINVEFYELMINK